LSICFFIPIIKNTEFFRESQFLIPKVEHVKKQVFMAIISVPNLLEKCPVMSYTVQGLVYLYLGHVTERIERVKRDKYSTRKKLYRYDDEHKILLHWFGLLHANKKHHKSTCRMKNVKPEYTSTCYYWTVQYIYSCSGPGGTQQGRVVFTSGKEEKRKGKGQGPPAGSGQGIPDGKAMVKPGVTSGQAATVKHPPLTSTKRMNISSRPVHIIM
jgi:hypothetical protein